MCKFIDQYVCCSVPDDDLAPEAQTLSHMLSVAYALQVHAYQSNSAMYSKEQAEEAMKAVRKVLDDKSTPEDILIEELLSKANISSDSYLCGLKMCTCVVMQRSPSESWINTYNPDVIRVWRANMVHLGSIRMCHVYCFIHAQES